MARRGDSVREITGKLENYTNRRDDGLTVFYENASIGDEIFHALQVPKRLDHYFLRSSFAESMTIYVASDRVSAIKNHCGEMFDLAERS